MKIFTVPNKNLEKMERMRKKALPWLARCKLYISSETRVAFPMGAMQKKFVAGLHPMTNPIEFKRELWTEQKQVLEQLEDRRSGLIEMKTGRGKSSVIMALANKFQEKVLIACHSNTCIQDMVSSFESECGITPSLYNSSKKQIGDVTITTHNSLSQKWQEFAGQFGVIIVDECDRNLTTNMMNALCLIDAEGIFGFTGTPRTKELTTENMELIFGKHIKVTGQDNNGYNLIPEILRVEYKTDKIYDFESWHELKEMIVADEERFEAQLNFINNTLGLKQISHGLLLVERKEQECDKYFKALKKMGINVWLINGDTKAKDDAEAVKEFTTKGGIIVGTVGKLGRGKDIPVVDGVFLFYPNRFNSNTIQAVGRGLRKFEGKTGCKLYDRVDYPILKSQAYERIQTYKQEYTDSVTISTLMIEEEEEK